MKHPTINETIVLVSELHRDQVDKLGAPYYFHPMRVMMRLGPNATDAEKHAALLHDVVEDTDATLITLRDRGYSGDVLVMVGLASRIEGETYDAFIDRIIVSGHHGTMRIKLGDLYDNSDEERLRDAPVEIREKLLAMARTRYHPAIAKLKLALGRNAETVISGCLGNYGQPNAMIDGAKTQEGSTWNIN